MSELKDQLQQGKDLLAGWKQRFTQAVANGGAGLVVEPSPLKEWLETGLAAEFHQDERYIRLADFNQRVQQEAIRIIALAKEDRMDEAMAGLNFSGDFYKVLSHLTNELTYWQEALEE